MASWTSAPSSPAPSSPGPSAVGGRPERGIVHRGTSADLFDLHRSAVGPNLAPFAQNLWEVRWDRRGAVPRVSRTIPFPSVNLTVEAGAPGEVRHGHRLPAALLHGVVTRTFGVVVRDTGWALAVKFHPGGWAAWSGRDAASSTDRVVPAGPLLASLGLPGLADDVLGAPAGERHDVLRAWLDRRAPEPDPDFLRLRALVDRMRDDPALVRVEQLPDLVGWSPRTLQRHFRHTVGVPAKWVLARFRLQEAAVELERDPRVDLAALATRLGWHDQAHFTNDFRRMLGTTPARYAAGARPADGTSTG